MKCKKCRKGKIKVIDTLFQLFGCSHLFYHVIGECSLCGHRLNYFMREKYNKYYSNIAVPPDETADDNWLDKCAERKLQDDNPELARILYEIGKDHNENQMLDPGFVSQAALSAKHMGLQAGKTQLTRQMIIQMINKMPARPPTDLLFTPIMNAMSVSSSMMQNNKQKRYLP